MKIRLMDQTELTVINITESIRGRKGEQILSISLLGNYSIANIKNIFNENNIKIIYLIDDNLNEKEILNYTKIDELNIEYDTEDLNHSIVSLILTQGISDI